MVEPSEATREQIPTTPSAEHRQPVADRGSGLLRDLKLHRPAGLLLDDHRSIANSAADEHVIDPQPDEITAPELAVDRQIEHRKIAPALFHFRADSDRPNVFRLQRTLLADQAPFVPGIAVPRGNKDLGGHGPLRKHRPPPPQRQIAVDGCNSVPE